MEQRHQGICRQLRVVDTRVAGTRTVVYVYEGRRGRTAVGGAGAGQGRQGQD